MIDRKKIRIMTKLALYDKKYGDKDRKTDDYFGSDYVYKKNAWTRFYTFLGSLIVLFFYWVHKITVKGVDIFALDFRAEGIKAALFILVVLTLYTFIGTAKSIAAYNRSQKRIQYYFGLLNHLDKHSQEAKKQAKDETGEISYVRGNITGS